MQLLWLLFIMQTLLAHVEQIKKKLSYLIMKSILNSHTYLTTFIQQHFQYE